MLLFGLLDVEDLRGHNREYLYVNAVEFVEATPGSTRS